MKKNVLLITGWGGGTKLLQPLKQQLEAIDFQVKLLNIFDVLDAVTLQKNIEVAKEFDVLIGWSLGGQLATILADQISKQYQQNKILITLGSNPCFVANENWQTAMDQPIFQAFKQSFKTDAVATLKKFGFMVCQGTENTKQDFLMLQSLIQPQNLDVLNAGLNCLEQLNNVDILEKYTGHQLHIFAKQDFLVSYKVARNLQKLSANFLEVELNSGSHGFPIFNTEDVISKISQYLSKIKQI